VFGVAEDVGVDDFRFDGRRFGFGFGFPSRNRSRCYRGDLTSEQFFPPVHLKVNTIFHPSAFDVSCIALCMISSE
jgi:hypothetical protein